MSAICGPACIFRFSEPVPGQVGEMLILKICTGQIADKP